MQAIRVSMQDSVTNSANSINSQSIEGCISSSASDTAITMPTPPTISAAERQLRSIPAAPVESQVALKASTADILSPAVVEEGGFSTRKQHNSSGFDASLTVLSIAGRSTRESGVYVCICLAMYCYFTVLFPFFGYIADERSLSSSSGRDNDASASDRGSEEEEEMLRVALAMSLSLPISDPNKTDQQSTSTK
jgi:hypothetical protein